MIIRCEEIKDVSAIRKVNVLAFPTDSEAQLVDNLRADGDAIISLVAIENDEIVGHILLSKMTAPLRALGLAPVAVLPKKQGKGIGGALIKAALNEAKKDDWEIIFVLGNPKIYGKYGFNLETAKGFNCAYSGPHFMAISLVNDIAITQCDIEYAPAFSRLG